MAAARKSAFVGPKAMLFGMPVAEKLQSAMGLQYRLDDRHLRPCLSYVAFPCSRGRTQPSQAKVMNITKLLNSSDSGVYGIFSPF